MKRDGKKKRKKRKKIDSGKRQIRFEKKRKPECKRD